MNIGEVEQRTGITKKNIRFYEKAGLLDVARNHENKYREYSEEDVQTLEQVKLLRKLGVTLEDIRTLQSGGIGLADCMDKYTLLLKNQMADMKNAVQLCHAIQQNGEELQTLQPGPYLRQMEQMENKGASFANIARDFITKARDSFAPRQSFIIEPEEPVMNPRDFTKELANWANKEGKHLVVLRESMVPRIELDGQAYMAYLRMPGMQGIFGAWFLSYYSLGFRFIYLYKLNEDGEIVPP